MKKKIFFERLTQYVNSDSVSERKSMKESIIRELHEYAERYLNLHKKYNSLMWIHYNHIISDVEFQNENVILTTSDHHTYELPMSFFFDFHEIELTKKLINEDIERTLKEIQYQHYAIKYAYNMIDEKNQRIKEYEKTLKCINSKTWAS